MNRLNQESGVKKIRGSLKATVTPEEQLKLTEQLIVFTLAVTIIFIFLVIIFAYLRQTKKLH